MASKAYIGLSLWFGILTAAVDALAVSKFLARPFISYGKGTLSLRPASSSSSPLHSVTDGNTKIPVWQPNIGPSVGFAVIAGDYLSVGITRAVRAWQPSPHARGHSQVTHLEAHSHWRGFGLDGYIQEYRGMYLTRAAARDARPFADSLFRQENAVKQYPTMGLSARGVGVLWVVEPEAFPVEIAMLHRKAPTANGLSPLVRVAFDEISFDARGPLLTEPEDRDLFDERYNSLTGIRASRFSVAPGLGAILILDQWYLSGAACWGLGVEDQTLRGISAGHKHNVLATVGNLRGSIASQREWFQFGLNGYKSVSTLNAPGFAFTHTVSLVELFAGASF